MMRSAKLQDSPWRNSGMLFVIFCIIMGMIPNPTEAQTFLDVGSSAGVNDTGTSMGVAWGDYDRDGDEDLVVTNLSGAIRLYQNQGMGTFQEVAAIAGITGSARWHSVIWGDYNNDGWLDLHVASEDSPNRLYRNNGNGTFTDVSTAAGVADTRVSHSAAWGDYNGDGWLDLYIAEYNQPNRLYRNNGDGTFTDIAVTAGLGSMNKGFGVAWGDYDNDGELDLYVGDLGSGRLFRNNGNLTFTDVTANTGVGTASRAIGVAWGDLDNDGWLDLYVVNDQNQPLVFHNNGNGTFTDQRANWQIDGTDNKYGVSFGDYDNDGDLDLYLANFTSANRLFRNGGTSNHWLTVNLIGTQSNRASIGAAVSARTGAVSQRRDVDGGSGLFSQPSLPVEFGFGNVTIVDSLIIHWPSGIVQTLTNVATNQLLTVTESSSMPDVATTPTMLAFGTVLVQDSHSETLTIKNLGDADLTVTAITHTNPVFSINTPFTVAPGDSHTVVVTFHPNTVGSEQDTLLIMSNDPDTPTLRIPLVGVGYPGPFSLSVDDISAAPGSLALVRLRLRNARIAISGMQFVLYADPAFLRPEPNALILHTRAAGFTASSVYDSTTGELRVVLFSLSNAVIDTGSASILDIPYTVNAAASIGGMTLLDLRMTTQDGHFATAFSDPTGARAVTPFDLIDGSLRFGFRGDVNFDRFVNILDVVQAVQVILGVAAFDPARALFFDVNMDGTINVLDIVGMVNLILYGPQPKVIAEAVGPVAVSLGEVSTLATGQMVVPVTMHSAGLIAGAQIAVTHDPAQVQMGVPHLIGRAEGMSLESRVTGGTLVLVLYSATDHGIPAGNGPTMLIPVTVLGGSETTPSVTLSQVLLANRQAQAIPVTLERSTVKVQALPSVFALKPNRPNPFNPTTQIAYEVPQPVHVTLALYNVLGQEVIRLVDAVQAPGRSVVTWDGRNGHGQPVASGVYLYRLTTSTGFVQTRRMTLVR